VDSVRIGEQRDVEAVIQDETCTGISSQRTNRSSPLETLAIRCMFGA
jgi:hypothetical protein